VFIFTAQCYRESGCPVPQYVICLSVCLSVTFRYVFHIGWSAWKIISRICLAYLPTSESRLCWLSSILWGCSR